MGGATISNSYKSDKLKEGIEMKSKLLPSSNYKTFLSKNESQPKLEPQEALKFSSIYDRDVFFHRPHA